MAFKPSVVLKPSVFSFSHYPLASSCKLEPKMRRLQKEISTSRMSWPIAAVLTFVFWFIAWLEDNVTFIPFVLVIATGLLMMWINHLFALIKVFSRMIASTYLAFTTALLITPDIGGYQTKVVFVQFCLVSFLILFFSCYQYRKAQGVILYAYLMLGIASLFFKQLLLMVPLMWILTAYCMVTFSGKIWLSSIFGIGLPYLFVYTYYLCAGIPYSDQTLINNWDFCRVFDFTTVPRFLKVSFVCSSLLTIMGFVHLMLEGHKDKVRTRMMYQIFITIGIYAILMSFLQPHHIAIYIGIMLISASAMVGHFFALTDTKNTNYIFMTIVAMTYLITIYNLI